jgi:hypothetical protein
MLRHEVEKVIIKYAPAALPIFADRFERWPVGNACLEIISHLEKARDRYGSMMFDVPFEASECQDAINALKPHIND